MRARVIRDRVGLGRGCTVAFLLTKWHVIETHGTQLWWPGSRWRVVSAKLRLNETECLTPERFYDPRHSQM